MLSLDKLASYYRDRGLRLLYLVFKDKGGAIVLVDPKKPDILPPETPRGPGISITIVDPPVPPDGD